MSQNAADAIDRFLEDLERQEASALTIRNYRSDLQHFGRWFAGSAGEPFSPAALTPTDVRDYGSHLVAVQKRAAATVNRRLAALRRFSQWAKAEGLIKELPTDQVKGVASTPRAPKWLQKREVDRLLRAAERSGNKRDLAILHTLYATGLRVGELCALELADIAISERKGQLIVRSGKGSKHRVVPLNLDVRRALEAYLQVRPKVDSRNLFIGSRGEGIKSQAVENLVKKYARFAGLEGVSPHTLRHSFGKHAPDAGVDW
jgi:site-specific recombinase XerD